MAKGKGTTRRRSLPTSCKEKARRSKRSNTLKQRPAASGASLAASGAASYVRHKVRVRGLFGARFWVYPEDKPALQIQLEELNAEFKKKTKKPRHRVRHDVQQSSLNTIHRFGSCWLVILLWARNAVRQILIPRRRRLLRFQGSRSS